MDHLRAFSPEALREMRSASRSPNKRSAAGASRDGDSDDDVDTDARAVELDSDADGCLIPSPPVLTPALLAPTLVTPFKRFRADSLLSPSKGAAGKLAVAAPQHSRLARRREASAFQSLADDRFVVVVKNVPAAAAPRDGGVDSTSSTQNSSQEEPSVGASTHECSPADVAALCSKLLVCSETLEDQMDALDVGSFLSWHSLSPSAGRPTVAAAANAPAQPLRHRRKPRIHFSDDALSLQDAFSEQTQLVSDGDDDADGGVDDGDDDDDVDEAEPEPPVLIAIAHFPLDGGCSCMGGDCDSDELERSWQVFSPPPHVGFDPKCCSADSDDFDSSSNEDDSDDDDDEGDDDATHEFCSQCA